jgi:membrane associated rhomboid family serine protease
MWCTFPQIFPLTMETFHMRKLLLMIAIGSPFALLAGVSSAKGCLKGAAVGGVVGHVAGHHAVAGAAAGCVIGHHRAKVRDREAAAAQPQDDAARPAGTTPAR